MEVAEKGTSVAAVVVDWISVTEPAAVMLGAPRAGLAELGMALVVAAAQHPALMLVLAHPALY